MTEMPFRVKKSRQTPGLNNDRGQATIEYMLLLFISVTLVLMLIYQIFTPMQAFVQSFMGDYVACLLETGALPSLEGSDTKAADMGCSAKFAEGKFNGGAGGSGSGSSGSSSSSSSSSKSASSNNSDNASGGSGAGGYAGSNSRRFGSSSGRGTESGSGSKKTTAVAANNDFVEGSGFMKGSSGSGWNSSRQGRRTASIDYVMMTDADKKKIAEKKDHSNAPMAVEEEVTTPVKKLTIKKPEPKMEIPPDEDPYTIGSFVRILFIACIILAIVIFVGGQALQMSKSGEK